MGKCRNHPDRETGFICLKHHYYLCESCLQCHDPEIYCKFRSSCIIHFIAQKGGDSIDRKDAAHTQNPIK